MYIRRYRQGHNPRNSDLFPETYHTSHSPQEVTQVNLPRFLDKKLQSFLPIYILTENANSYSLKIHPRSSYYAGLIPLISHLNYSHLLSNPKVTALHSACVYRQKPNMLQDVSHSNLPSMLLWPLCRTGGFTIYCSYVPFLCMLNYFSYMVYLLIDGDSSVFCYDLNIMLTQ